MSLVLVVSAHLKVLEAEGQTLLLASDWIEPVHCPVLVADLGRLVFLLSELLHGSCEEVLVFRLCSQHYSLLLWPDWPRRVNSVEMGVVSASQRGHLRVVGAKDQSGLVGMLLGLVEVAGLLGCEEALEAGGVGVGVVVGVLELVNVANSGQILAIAGVVFLEKADSLKDSFIWFINFHKLQLYKKRVVFLPDPRQSL